jgi:hypothetical protein
MKTHSIEWSPVVAQDRRIALNPLGHVRNLLALATKALLALASALALVVAATWLVTLPDQVVYLQATIWAAGFVFIGIAIESDSVEAAILGLATGMALPVLASLSSSMGVELIIVAATLIAAWIAAAILRR